MYLPCKPGSWVSPPRSASHDGIYLSPYSGETDVRVSGHSGQPLPPVYLVSSRSVRNSASREMDDIPKADTWGCSALAYVCTSEVHKNKLSLVYRFLTHLSLVTPDLLLNWHHFFFSLLILFQIVVWFTVSGVLKTGILPSSLSQYQHQEEVTPDLLFLGFMQVAQCATIY